MLYNGAELTPEEKMQFFVQLAGDALSNKDRYHLESMAFFEVLGQVLPKGLPKGPPIDNMRRSFFVDTFAILYGNKKLVEFLESLYVRHGSGIRALTAEISERNSPPRSPVVPNPSSPQRVRQKTPTASPPPLWRE